MPLPFARLSAGILIAAALGVLHALSFAPWHLPWLQVLALAGLFAVAERSPRDAAAALGFVFGLGWFGTGVHWVYGALVGPASMPATAAIAAMATLAAVLATFPLLAMWVGRGLGPTPEVRLLATLPVAWTAMEWSRGWVLTGFPWLSPGYAHIDGPLAGFAPVVGVTGLNGITALTAGLLVLAAGPTVGPASRRAAATVAIAALVGAGWLLGQQAWTGASGPQLAIRLVQGAIPQSEKFNDDGRRAVEHYLPLATAGKADITVLPETVFPRPLQSLPPDVLDHLATAADRTGGVLILGAFVAEDVSGQRVRNSVLAVSAGSSLHAAARYDKRRLLPFAEFVPTGFRWFVDMMHMPIGDQIAGRIAAPALPTAGTTVGALVCYELAFPALARSYMASAAPPGLLVNVSNFAWFTNSWALDQHRQIGQMRALETGRPLLIASAAGPTAVVGADGRVQAVLAGGTAGVLEARVSPYAGSTPYARWGDIPTLSLCLLAIVASWTTTRRTRRKQGGNT